MAIIIILISISLVIAVSFLMTFLWNLKSGQYEDTYSPAVRMLFDAKAPRKTVSVEELNRSKKNVKKGNV